VGCPRSNSVIPLMLWIIVYNGWITGIVLQVHRDSANLTEKG
jgi:hypothetical protein